MLIVEDYEPMRIALRDLLQLNYPQARILEAADGASALALFREHAPNLVVTDIELPDINGFELIREMRRSNPAVRVIVVSQHSDRAHMEHAIAAGAMHYVTKQAADRELLPAVAAAARAADPSRYGRPRDLGDHP